MHGSSSVPKEWVERINNAGGKMKSTSGVPEEQYLPAAKMGVCKVNIDTDGRLVWCAIHREAFRDDPANFDLRRQKDLHGRLRRLHRAQKHDARLGRPVGGRAKDAQEIAGKTRIRPQENAKNTRIENGRPTKQTDRVRRSIPCDLCVLLRPFSFVMVPMEAARAG